MAPTRSPTRPEEEGEEAAGALEAAHVGGFRNPDAAEKASAEAERAAEERAEHADDRPRKAPAGAGFPGSSRSELFPGLRVDE